MRKRWILGVVGGLSIFLVGCGGGGDSAPIIVPIAADVPGDAVSDGYSENALPTPIAFQNDGIRAQSPLGLSPERRGFVSYPLTDIPVGAFVETADARIFVDFVIQDDIAIPVSLDVYHVYYGSPLFGSDFNAPRVFVTTFQLFDGFRGDLPFFEYAPVIQLDVDDPAHAFFQLMLVARNGVVEIEDSENFFGTTFIPLLQTTFLPP